MANIRMANSLKDEDYDFHFSFAKRTCKPRARRRRDSSGVVDLVGARHQITPDPEEKDKPYFRVEIVSRDTE